MSALIGENGIAIPVIAGLVIGIAFVLLFSLYSTTSRDIVNGTTRSGISVSLEDLKDQYALSEPLNFKVTARQLTNISTMRLQRIDNLVKLWNTKKEDEKRHLDMLKHALAKDLQEGRWK